MLIADAQVHIRAAHRPDRPWPSSERSEPFSADDLLAEMDAAGVDRVVIVPPSWEGDRNDLALTTCRWHPQRFAVMGRFDPVPANAPLLARGIRRFAEAAEFGETAKRCRQGMADGTRRVPVAGLATAAIEGQHGGQLTAYAAGLAGGRRAGVSSRSRLNLNRSRRGRSSAEGAAG